MENFAVIDLGSNSVRMTITRINDDGTYEPVKQMKSYVRLSENMGEAHVLQPAAIDRTLTALQSFKDVYKGLDNLQIKAVATAATRQAVNQKKVSQDSHQSNWHTVRSDFWDNRGLLRLSWGQ